MFRCVGEMLIHDVLLFLIQLFQRPLQIREVVTKAETNIEVYLTMAYHCQISVKSEFLKHIFYID